MAAVRAFLAATIEDEATCVGMVYDNPQLSVVQYIQSLYTATPASFPPDLSPTAGASTSSSSTSPTGRCIRDWPYATTVRTAGATNCDVNAK